MNTQQTQSTEMGQAAALQTLFPGGVAALDASTVRALLTEYAEARARYSGPIDMPAARDGGATRLGHAGAYELRPGGVAVVHLGGLMLQRPGLIARLFLGAIDTEQVAEAISAAAADPEVRSIMLRVNSPGGAVHGTAELAAAVKEAANLKPVVGITDGSACSAAYWAVSSCSRVYGTSPNVMVGSIGVVSVHTYTPSASGVVVTEIKSGRFKAVGSSSKPLSSDDLAYLQERIDYLATQFINAVAANRGLAPAAVAAQEARVFIGQQAVDAGLMDGIMSVGDLERQLANDPSRFARRQGKPIHSAAVVSKATAAQSTWPPKLKAVVYGPVSQDELIGSVVQAEQDIRAEAAEIVRTYKMTMGRWPKVMAWKAWEQAGAARAKRDGCSLIEGIKREGYLHPYVSTPEAHKRGTPGVQPRIQLTKHQIAERGAAWAQFKGIDAIEAFKWLGV